MQEEIVRTEETMPRSFTEILNQEADIEKLYPLDQEFIEFPVQLGKFTVCHKLRKPTTAQLSEHNQQTPYRSEQVSDHEEELQGNDIEANAKLWDKLAEAVKGYGKTEIERERWILAGSLSSESIPGEIKSKVIRSLYDMDFKIEESGEDEGPVLLSSGMIYTVVQTMPGYTVRHQFYLPPESARREFRRKATQVRFSRGGKSTKTAIYTNLKSYTDLYNKVFKRIDGVSFAGNVPNVETLPQCLEAIDAYWKRSAIDCLMREFEGNSQG